MRLIKSLKKNKGSTLTTVLFLLFILSVTAIAVVTVTGTELGMSVMTSDRSKAFMAAQAGAEKAAQLLDEQVAISQDKARVTSSNVVLNRINSLASTAGTPFDGVIDISDPDEIKVLDEAKLDDIYFNEYKYWFYSGMNSWIELQAGSEGEWESGIVHEIENGADSGIPDITRAGSYKYGDVTPNISGTVQSIDRNNDDQNRITSISLTSTGEFKNSAGSSYKRNLRVEFGLLTESNGETEEIPISYGKLTKTRVNKYVKPAILSGLAAIAQGNIISIDGTAKISGHAVSFGTIPGSEAIHADKYKHDISGYAYGGFMAGVTTGVLSDPDFGTGINTPEEKTLGENLLQHADKLGIDRDNFTNINHTGAIEVDGNVGTMAYIHNLYGDSKITVSGDAFARGVKIEDEAHSSKLQLHNAYISDDLRIDANNAEVRIGDWNGDNPDKDQKGLLVGLNTGTLSPYSSSVAVSGDSNLYVNGSIYMGGSTYFKEYTLADKEMYPSGISVLKSGSLPAQAFEMTPEDIMPVPSKDTPFGNIFYLYNNEAGNAENPYIYVNNPDEELKLIKATYNKPSDEDGLPIPIVMMNGAGIPVEEHAGSYTELHNPFTIIERAMHFRYIWLNQWKEDLGFSTYLNTGDIQITPANNGKLDGWCFGAVAANDDVYGPYDGFNDNTAGFSSRYTNEWIPAYTGIMKLFLANQSPDSLNGVEPQRLLAGNSSASADSVNTAAAAPDNLILSKSNIMMFNSSENMVLAEDYISNTKVRYDFEKDEDGFLKGIIYSSGDIYVKAGTKFKGVLIAGGSIVFMGSSEIQYDEDVIDILMNEEPQAGRFFKFSAEDILVNNEGSLTTIKKSNVKNIKILQWKEI